VVAACLPDPATLGDKMTGLTCAGTWVTGTGRDGAPREVYLYHVVDNAWSMAEYGSQAVVWQTAVNPVVALELIESGAWAGAGGGRGCPGAGKAAGGVAGGGGVRAAAADRGDHR
jgi:saccharopine dehydrogenase-like NADP-dependent oxidoreductase